MDPEIAELVASLPDDSRECLPAEELRELLRALSSKPVPTGRVARAWSMGLVPVKMAAVYAASALRGTFADEEKKALLRNRAHLHAAARMLAGMGYLRGAFAKLGQALACYPNLVPEQFIELLETLHFQAPPMHYALVREQLHNELGGDPEELFAEFETSAFAAASLGQVHRARSHAGERLAVKVQYPGIARTIRADAKNLRLLFQPMRLTRDWPNMMDVFADMEETVSHETDYVAEAASLERMRAILADLDQVVVPRYYPELSTARVLAMEYLPGVHMREYMAREPAQAERDRFAELILRATYRPWCRERLIHSDCNPGNFLFLDDGRLGLVDFGCIRPIDDDGWEVMLLAMQGMRGDDGALLSSIEKGGLLSPQEMQDGVKVDLLRASCEWLWEPVRVEEFDFGDGAYLTRGFEIYSELVKRRITRHMPVFTWMNRMLFGVRGLFHALRARVPYRRIDEEEIASAGISF